MVGFEAEVAEAAGVGLRDADSPALALGLAASYRKGGKLVKKTHDDLR
jgi:hypothetical protein